jgi:4-hydroxybenzoate polyprenyltransferase
MDNPSMNKKDIPLVVDLDGTFVHTDILYEGVLRLFKKNPLYFFSVLLWALKGKVFLKKQIAARTVLRYDLLPVNQDLFAFLQKEFVNGRKLVLATASLAEHANAIAQVYPIFSEVYGTEIENLYGKNKLKLLVHKFGAAGFDYIGDADADAIIFDQCRYGYLVNPSVKLQKHTALSATIQHTWQSNTATVKDGVKAIRAYQWIKNILIFVPVVTSHSFFSIDVLLDSITGFIAFSLTASAGYLINDLLDLEADRTHPRKKFRPFAAGKISIPIGVTVAFLLLAAAILLSWQLPPLFLAVLLLYFTISFLYSLYFKKIVLYDVFILAMLYSTRVIAGGLVTNIPISFWLIAFSTFIFLSLAFVKRYSELLKASKDGGLQERGREYSQEDLGLLQAMGVASGFAAVVVFSLYIDSPDVAKLYSHPKILWAISLLFLFWISRIWVITNRGKMTDDPIVFTIKDSSSYCIFFITALIIFLAI